MKTQEFSNYLKNETFNVYKLEYTQQFKDNLPVVWEKWANKDLTNIPYVYHILFRTDWNWGPYSKMDMEDRMELHNLWLEYNKWEVKKISDGLQD